MNDNKFKVKIKKLIDISFRIEEVQKNLVHADVKNSQHKLDKICFELGVVHDMLSEFSTFHAYVIIERVKNVFVQIAKKEQSFTESLFEIVVHLLKIAHQQIMLMQNVIENKVIADETLDILEVEQGKENRLFDFVKNDIKLPALTFTVGVQDLKEFSEKKKALTTTAPTGSSIPIDEDNFDKMQATYVKVINAKNDLARSKSQHVQNLRSSINEFTEFYEKLSFVPVKMYLDKVIGNSRGYINCTDKKIVLNFYWGKAKYLYYNINYLEKYFNLLIELIVDYGFEKKEEEQYLEIKADTTNSMLTFEVTSNTASVEAALSKANEWDDHRFTAFSKLEKKLKTISRNIQVNEDKHSFYVDIPLRNNIYTVYLVKRDDSEFFVLEDEMIKFVNLTNDFVEKNERGTYYYHNEKQKLPILWDENLDEKALNKIGIMFGEKDNYFVIAFDEVVGKEHLYIDLQNKESLNQIKGFVKYGEDKVPIVEGRYNTKKPFDNGEAA